MVHKTHAQPLQNNEHFIHLFNKIHLFLHVNNMYQVGKKTFGKFLADIVKQKMTNPCLQLVYCPKGKVRYLYELVNENLYVLKYSVTQILLFSYA